MKLMENENGLKIYLNEEEAFCNIQLLDRGLVKCLISELEEEDFKSNKVVEVLAEGYYWSKIKSNLIEFLERVPCKIMKEAYQTTKLNGFIHQDLYRLAESTADIWALEEAKKIEKHIRIIEE